MFRNQSEVDLGVVDAIADHELALLRAGTQRDGCLTEHLDEWERLRPPTGIDMISEQLLPLVFRRVAEEDVDHPIRSTLRDSYRRNWATNERRRFRAAPLFGHLASDRIDAVLLKGGAMLTAAYCDDIGIRVVGDFDLLVSPDDIRGVLAWATDHGWRLKWEATDSDLETALLVYHAVSVRDEVDGLEIDVHQSMLARDRSPELDRLVFASAESTLLGDIEVAVPAPSHQLAHTLMHVAPIGLRHVADGLEIMARRGADVDWALVCDQVERRRSVTRALRTIAQMQAVQRSAVPDEVVDRLSTARLHWSDRDIEATSSVRASLVKVWQHGRGAGVVGRMKVAKALARQRRAAITASDERN